MIYQCWHDDILVFRQLLEYTNGINRKLKEKGFMEDWHLCQIISLVS